jgi:hypothetical protein
MLSLIVFMAAIIIFIGLFSQSIQTSVAYERHRTLGTEASDLLDNVLLNPGIPSNWSTSDSSPACLGLQDPEYMQYTLSPFSLMRLTSSTQTPVLWNGAYFNNNTGGSGSCVLTPLSKSVNYSTAYRLLGINGTYGFQLTLTPTLTISTTKVSSGSPLKLAVTVDGTGFPLANAAVTYNLLLVNQSASTYPSYTVISGTNRTDLAGRTSVTFPGVDGETQTYTFLIYAYLGGLKGMGYYVNVPSGSAKSVVPIVESYTNRTICLAHSDSVGAPPQNPQYSQLSYNATFVLLSEDYSLRPIQLTENATGNVTYNQPGQSDFASLAVPNNFGVLIVTYKNAAAGQYGIVLMPWGLSSLSYTATLGGNPEGQEWVATDIRQVTIGGIAYQAKIAVWSVQGVQGLTPL